MKRPRRKAAAPDDLSPDYLGCRVDRHAWERHRGFTDIEWLDKRRTRAVLTRVLKCPHCETVKTITYGYPSMEILKVRMKYPDGYLVAEGRQYGAVDYRTRYLAPMVRRNRG